MTKPKQPWRCQKCDCAGVTIPRATPRSTICAWCADELRKAGQRWCSTGRHGSSDWTNGATMCRDCQHDCNVAYRAAHLEKAIAYSCAYAAAHRDELIANSRAYYQANRDRLLEQKKVYYQQRRELLKAKARAHRRYRKPELIARERARQHAKHQIYKHNQKLARARRFIASLRGAASSEMARGDRAAAAIVGSGEAGQQ